MIFWHSFLIIYMVCFPIQIGSSKATFSSCLISVTHSWLGMNEGRLHNLLTLGSCVFSMGKHFPFHRFIDSLLHLILIKNFNSNYYTNCYIIYSPLVFLILRCSVTSFPLISVHGYLKSWDEILFFSIILCFHCHLCHEFG